MSYVQSMAKKNLYLNLSADVIGSSLSKSVMSPVV